MRAAGVVFGMNSGCGVDYWGAKTLACEFVKMVAAMS
jgi:hypothetical protein